MLDGSRLLLPETLELMLRTHYSPHPAMPGWAYGFAEMQRNGWRALQRDGAGEGAQARLVFVPEARRGYFVVVRGEASGQFWRTLDDALFDRLLVPRTAAADLRGTAAPGAEDAERLAGLYRARSGGGGAFLRAQGGRIRLAGREDGALIVTGTENLTLSPAAGGYWRSAGTGIPAALVEGSLRLGNIAYRRVPIWTRAEFLLLCGVLSALAALALFVSVERVPAAGPLSRDTMQRAWRVFAGLAAAFLFLALALHGAA